MAAREQRWNPKVSFFCFVVFFVTYQSRSCHSNSACYSLRNYLGVIAARISSNRSCGLCRRLPPCIVLRSIDIAANFWDCGIFAAAASFLILILIDVDIVV
jgi:hypothetical protein